MSSSQIVAHGHQINGLRWPPAYRGFLSDHQNISFSLDGFWVSTTSLQMFNGNCFPFSVKSRMRNNSLPHHV